MRRGGAWARRRGAAAERIENAGGRGRVTPEVAGVLFAVGTSVAFGVGSPIARLGLVGTPVVTGTVISMLAGAALLLAVAAPRYPSELGAIGPSGWALVAFTAALNYPIGRLMLFNAMRRIGVARGNTIVSANPVVASVLAILWLGESLGLQTAAGMGACVGGAALVAWTAGRGPSADASALAADPRIAETTTGVASAAGAMVAYGTVGVFIKKIVSDVTEPLIAASLVFSTGAGMLTLMALPRLRRELRQISFRRGWQLAVGGSGMSLGILLFYNALSRAPITSIAPVVALAPLFAILVSQVIARRFEVVDGRIWAGAIAVVSGVALITAAL